MIPKGFIAAAVAVSIFYESELSPEWQIVIMGIASVVGTVALVLYQRWREDRILRHIDTRIENSTKQILDAMPLKPAAHKKPTVATTPTRKRAT